VRRGPGGGGQPIALALVSVVYLFYLLSVDIRTRKGRRIDTLDFQMSRPNRVSSSGLPSSLYALFPSTRSAGALAPFPPSLCRATGLGVKSHLHVH
jgi:hypothetical protein